MAVNEIPIAPVPNQTLSFVVGDESYFLALDLRNDAIFLSGAINGERILYNRILLPFTPIDGRLMLIDIEGGTEPPNYKELGTRYRLEQWTD